MRAAASRTFWTAGSSRPIRMAMMAITTSNSISVNAFFHRTGAKNIERPSKKGDERKNDAFGAGRRKRRSAVGYFFRGRS